MSAISYAPFTAALAAPWLQAEIDRNRDRAFDGLVIATGLVVIVLATGIAIRTFMVPSGAPPLINRVIFRFTQFMFDAIVQPIRSEDRRHSILSLYAPISLLVVLATITFLIAVGYTLTFYGVGVKPLIRAFLFSGSALSTLGFESPGNNFWVIILSSAEALTVVTVVALLIGYLPAIYSSYNDREEAVRRLESLVGAPPDGIKIIDSWDKAMGAANIGQLWQTWQTWFDDLASSGSTLSGELYLRSARWDRSWICAAGAMLDAAALMDSSVDLTTNPAADRLVRHGARALLEVLEPLRLHCPAQPTWPETSINVTQEEFAQAFDHLKQAGLPMKADQQAAWEKFASLRVQYECALMALIRVKKPPRGARWTTDRPEADTPLPIGISGFRSAVCGAECQHAAKAARSLVTRRH